MGLLDAKESPLVDGIARLGGEDRQPCEKKQGTDNPQDFTAAGMTHGLMNDSMTPHM